MPDADSSAVLSHINYVFVRSRGAHGWHAVGRFDAFVGVDREIWIGSDGSGAIRESTGPVDFFTAQARAQWEAAGSPQLAHGPVVEFYGPGGLSTRARLSGISSEPESLAASLFTLEPLTLKAVYHVLGETLVAADVARAVYRMAAAADGIEVLGAVTDQLGRRGHGLAADEHGQRLELVFDRDTTMLLGYQRFLTDPSHGYAPVGTLVSWTAYLDRRLMDALPRRPAIH